MGEAALDTTATTRVYVPSKDEIAGWNRLLNTATPEKIIQFAWQKFPHKLAVATQFGVEGATLLHRVAQIAPQAHYFTIDTGLLFHETYTLADELEKLLGIKIARIKPEKSVAEQAVTHGANLWERDPDLCCTLRKVMPMQDALSGMSAWMTGIRREQSHTRLETPVVQWDERFGLVKFAPLANQSKDAIESYVEEYQLPTNPLRKLGYLSLGCFTCTRPVKPGEDARAGRWSGRSKTECGLHVTKTDTDSIKST